VLIQVRVERLTLDHSTQSPVVVLREDDGERSLPIWIGAGEASAIHMHMAHMSVGRPLTHDLLVAAIEGLGARLERVVINKVEQNTYYARLELVGESGSLTLDARPSDSIAIALRMGAPIYAEDDLLAVVRFESAEGEDSLPPSAFFQGLSKPKKAKPKPVGPPNPARPGSGEGLSAGELEAYLRKLNPEDFGRFNP
jgi:bifunctional DNase/RNase